MRETLRLSTRPIIAGTLLVAGGGILAASLAGWLTFGSSILLTYAEAGLSWCF